MSHRMQLGTIVALSSLLALAGHTASGAQPQGALTEVRGSVKHEYKPGDVIKVSEGTTHHAENYRTVPAVYIEINTTAKN